MDKNYLDAINKYDEIKVLITSKYENISDYQFNTLLIEVINSILIQKLPKGTGCDSILDDYRFIKDKGSAEILSKLALNGTEYEHKIYEQGGGGDCLYCCYAAAINELNRKNGNSNRVSFLDLRNIIADQIQQMESVEDLDMLKRLFWTEYNYKPDEEAIDDIIFIKDYLIKTTRKARCRWASAFDIKILQNMYNIGIIVLNSVNGNVWCYGEEKKYPYYTLILHDFASRIHDDNYGHLLMPNGEPNHYTNIGIKKTGSSGDYEFLIKCDEIPETIIQNAINNCKGHYKTIFGCP